MLLLVKKIYYVYVLRNKAIGLKQCEYLKGRVQFMIKKIMF